MNRIQQPISPIIEQQEIKMVNHQMNTIYQIPHSETLSSTKDIKIINKDACLKPLKVNKFALMERRSTKVLNSTLSQIQTFIKAQQVAHKAQKKLDAMLSNATNLSRRVGFHLQTSQNFLKLNQHQRPNQLKKQAQLLEGFLSACPLINANYTNQSLQQVQSQSSSSIHEDQNKAPFDVQEARAFRSIISPQKQIPSQNNMFNFDFDSRPLSIQGNHVQYDQPQDTNSLHKEFMLTGDNIIGQMKKIANDVKLFNDLDSNVYEIYNYLDRSQQKVMQIKTQQQENTLQLQIKSASKKLENLKKKGNDENNDQGKVSNSNSVSSIGASHGDVGRHQSNSNTQHVEENTSEQLVAPTQSNEFEGYMMTKQFDMDNDSCLELMSVNGSFSNFASGPQSDLLSETDFELTHELQSQNQNFDVDQLLVQQQPQDNIRKHVPNKLMRARVFKAKPKKMSTFRVMKNYLEESDHSDEEEDYESDDQTV